MRTIKATKDGNIGIAVEFKCPKCDDVSTDSLNVTIKPYEGDYCMKCWAKWISENVTKLLKVKKEKK